MCLPLNGIRCILVIVTCPHVKKKRKKKKKKGLTYKFICLKLQMLLYYITMISVYRVLLTNYGIVRLIETQKRFWLIVFYIKIRFSNDRANI